MVTHATPSCRLILASVVLATVARVEAQLASRSPFMPPQSAASNTPTQGAPLEFGGYLDSPSEGRLYRITVKDPTRKTTSGGAWVKLNEKNSELDVVVKQHDESQKPATLTIEHQGKTLTLAEKESKITSSGSAPQLMPQPQPAGVAPTPPPQNVPPAVTQAVVLNPTPQDEQRRLEAVAAEVARRRALREQATQQVGGNPPQGQPPTPSPAQLQQLQQQQQQQRTLPPGVPVPANMPGRAIPSSRQPR